MPCDARTQQGSDDRRPGHILALQGASVTRRGTDQNGVVQPLSQRCKRTSSAEVSSLDPQLLDPEQHGALEVFPLSVDPIVRRASCTLVKIDHTLREQAPVMLEVKPPAAPVRENVAHLLSRAPDVVSNEQGHVREAGAERCSGVHVSAFARLPDVRTDAAAELAQLAQIEKRPE